MSKDIFREVPKEFHERFVNTLNCLNEVDSQHSVKKFSLKKGIILLVAIVAAMGTITAGAAGIYQWHQEAMEKLGASPEVAEKFVVEGNAKEEHAVVEKNDITINAVMSVATDRGYYLLFQVTTSRNVLLSVDAIFENVNVISEEAFGGVTVGMVEGSCADNAALYSVELVSAVNMDYAGETVKICFENLVQTDKADIAEVLVDAAWEIPITLPLAQETRIFYQSGIFTADFHEVNIDRVEISSSTIKLYGNWKELYHVTNKQSVTPPCIRYVDGTLVQPQSGVGQTSYDLDNQTGEGFMVFSLDVLLDVDKVEALVFEDCEIVLGETIKTITAAGNETCNLEEIIEAESVEEIIVHYLYNTDHAIIYDAKNLYLWDTLCNYAEVLVDLEKISYNEEAGGEMLVCPGQTMYILPDANSNKVYIIHAGYGLKPQDRVLERSREDFWENAKAYYYTNDVEYRVVSEDGSIEKMTLEEVK